MLSHANVQKTKKPLGYFLGIVHDLFMFSKILIAVAKEYAPFVIESTLKLTLLCLEVLGKFCYEFFKIIVLYGPTAVEKVISYSKNLPPFFSKVKENDYIKKIAKSFSKKTPPKNDSDIYDVSELRRRFTNRRDNINNILPNSKIEIKGNILFRFKEYVQKRWTTIRLASCGFFKNRLNKQRQIQTLRTPPAR
jgi:hypothetical protein